MLTCVCMCLSQVVTVSLASSLQITVSSCLLLTAHQQRSDIVVVMFCLLLCTHWQFWHLNSFCEHHNCSLSYYTTDLVQTAFKDLSVRDMGPRCFVTSNQAEPYRNTLTYLLSYLHCRYSSTSWLFYFLQYKKSFHLLYLLSSSFTADNSTLSYWLGN